MGTENAAAFANKRFFKMLSDTRPDGREINVYCDNREGTLRGNIGFPPDTGIFLRREVFYARAEVLQFPINLRTGKETTLNEPNIHDGGRYLLGALMEADEDCLSSVPFDPVSWRIEVKSAEFVKV